MKCPKCGEDLIHLSGRYLCSDCGNEVPESEVSVGGWNFSDDADSKKEQIPGDVQVNNFDDAITDSEDYLVEYVSEKKETEPQNESSEEASNISEDVQPESTEPVVEETIQEDQVKDEEIKGFYTAADFEDEAVEISKPKLIVDTEEKSDDEVVINLPEKPQASTLSEVENTESVAVAPKDILGEDLLDDQNSQTPVTIAPIDEELLVSPTMEDSENERGSKTNNSKALMPAWVKILPIALLVILLLGGLIFLVVDYVKKNNNATNTEIENPSATSWVDYKNSEHSFGIFMPNRPKSGKTNFKVNEQDLPTTVFESEENTERTYRVHVVELSESLSKLENDDLMTLLAQSFTKKDNFTLGSQEEVSVDTAFGLDIEAKGDQKNLQARLVKIENKVYILSLVYNGSNNVEKYQDFVRSFKLIQESI